LLDEIRQTRIGSGVLVPTAEGIRPFINLAAESLGVEKKEEALLCEYNEKCQFGKKRIRLMAITGASNVLGVFNNLEEISRIVHRYGARLLVDATAQRVYA
jgi:selenocysteine lyase/cysteine desulfurase